ncbi:MAG: sensor histidine kinase [Acidimicrobiales bacterium]
MTSPVRSAQNVDQQLASEAPKHPTPPEAVGPEAPPAEAPPADAKPRAHLLWPPWRPSSAGGNTLPGLLSPRWPQVAGRPDPACAETKTQWALARRLFFPGVFLVVLIQTGAGVARYSSGAGIVAGDAILVVFSAAYLYSLLVFWSGRLTRFWLVYGMLVALWLAELPFAHGDAFVMVIFIAVLSIASLRRLVLPVVALLTAVSVLVPAAIPSWHQGVDTNALLGIAMISIAMYAFFALVRSNQALVEARSEVARLAAENERTRIARDLHDLLGHSLTTITVKAGLARRLAATDPTRSTTEIAEVEELSRRCLNDVRAVVSQYRDVTLAGELAAGRELLRAAGIDARLPTATDMVAPEHQALFAWVVREGLTNVVRHAHATTCAVTLGERSLEMVDNGVGGDAHPGNGLAGLRERVHAAGGTLEAGPLAPSGWRIHVEVPAPVPA